MSQFATDSDYEVCRKIHRKFGTTYYMATLRFPGYLRKRVHAVYAFVRVPDEWVDNPGEMTIEARADCLRRWREEMRLGLAGNRVDHPVMRAFCDVAKECAIPTAEAERFLDAMEMDLAVTRYQTYDDLRDYMRGSASAVGILMCYAMEAQVDEDLLERAKALGEAMQLTNFLRDIGEDLDRGRVYMPQQDLQSFGLSLADIVKRRVTPEFRRFMTYEIRRARELYEFADEGIARLPVRMQRAVLLARVLYSRILDEIEANDYDVFNKRARTSSLTKLRALSKVSLTRLSDPLAKKADSRKEASL